MESSAGFSGFRDRRGARLRHQSDLLVLKFSLCLGWAPFGLVSRAWMGEIEFLRQLLFLVDVNAQGYLQTAKKIY